MTNFDESQISHIALDYRAKPISFTSDPTKLNLIWNIKRYYRDSKSDKEILIKVSEGSGEVFVGYYNRKV